ncbi:hypothetical protein CPB85DRAFT_893005 [Mucidula mucida]|nr:hypothetical protein CPB85DRAFT_893005 [Mucidula mucida]
MVITLFFTLTCLYVRVLYRLAELSQGFVGDLFHTQAFFTVLDGEMMLLVLWALNFGHPGRLLSEDIEPEVEKPWMLGEPLEGFSLVPDTDIGDGSMHDSCWQGFLLIYVAGKSSWTCFGCY